MTFVHLSLLAGSAFVAVPILLHLIMRRKPKLFEFPALRFLQQRRDVNQRRLRLRHLLLLLLRALAIALLALALARPSLKFSDKLFGFPGSQEAPVAAVLVFDTAEHMHYRHENKTRLDAARELGRWLLTQLPSGSQTAVLDTALAQRGFDTTLGLSQERVERLEVQAASQPVVRVVGDALALFAQSDLPRKEVYVFTDLSRSAWPADAAAMLQDRMEKSEASVYLIDVGVAEPIDFGLGEVRLSQQVLSVGGGVDLSTSITCLGAAGRRSVEIDTTAAGGEPQTWGERTVALRPGETRSIEFHLSSLQPGVHQGRIRILGQDGLAEDDTRYFTIEVRPPWPVLVAANWPVEENAIHLVAAVAPPEFRKQGQAPFDVQLVGFQNLARQPLEKYAAVCLLDPPPLEPLAWQKLTDYVSAGHSLAIFLGRHALPVDSFNALVAQQLLPGKLRAQVPRREGDNCLAPRDFQHPILKAFAPWATSTPWYAFPVFRYWELADPPAGTVTLLSYTDGRPALVERPVGAGRVLVMTTPISDDPNRRDAWNLLTASAVVRGAWPFVILARQMMNYLVGGGRQQLNYTASETVSLALDDAGPARPYVVTAPDGVKTTYTPQRQELTISAAEQPGNYRVQPGGPSAHGDHGFSINLAAGQTELARVDEPHLKTLFGPFNFRLARTKGQIDLSVSVARVGRELYPLLICLLAAVLAVEYLVANRFYGKA